MRRWSPVALAAIVALIFTGLAVYYAVPVVYHPFTSDTVLTRSAHVLPAVVFLALAGVAALLGRLLRPNARE